ncbi:hypothetical protein BDN67DRAFT_984564 [Paxillus ammoniavirescens]|nr:hypothetical protein BDN67DRAFT_984564 [Paxillus ammoniavirescens]
MDTKKWQMDSTLFRRDAKLAGTVNLSPAWFQQGHSHPLEASALLKSGRNKEEVKQWLAAIFKAHSHLSAAMGVMHPQMYAIGRDTLIKIWEDASVEIREVLRVWPSVYSSLSLMVNQCSPYHLEKMGKPQWFDQLLTMGHYSDLDLVLSTL